MAKPLDLDQVRGSFPALSAGQIFFDNAGGTQILGTVAERYRLFLPCCLVASEINTGIPASGTTSSTPTSSWEPAIV
jgi:Selenocysteine lyase